MICSSVFFGLFLWRWIVFSDASIPSAEQSLVEGLLSHNVNVRPVRSQNTTTRVIFGLEIVQIISVDNRNQVLKTNVWIRQRWKNELMVWNSIQYEGVNETRLDPQTVWTPDIVLYNSADSESNSGVEKFKTRVIVGSDGSSAWYSPAIYITTCELDITYFPFDQQNCSMQFGSSTFTATEVDLITANSPMFTDKFTKSSEWELIAAWKIRRTQTHACCKEPLAYINIEMIIRRKPLFYAFNLITPCMIILSVILYGFCLPPESKERITLNITVLLAMCVFIQLMAEALPRSARNTPLLGRFYLMIMSEVAVSLFATCCVLNTHHRNLGTVASVRMPAWIEVVVLHWLAAVLCVRRLPPYLESQNDMIDVENSNHTLTHDIMDKVSPVMNGHAHRVTNGHAHKEKPAVLRCATHSAESESLPLASFMKNRCTNSRTHDRYLRDASIMARRRSTKRAIEKGDQKWKHVALVMDRLFFWLFVITIIMSTLIVFKEKFRQIFGEDYADQ
ncbi:neuronal acetylcholine receptor subunit beta-4-like [Actinia tenebrosa]|uniref:Neuronal acetylcholine receptor subunit beta-4-like n=1 Tax=Actinia tenebrosa TaxID=6105 RepID=A0A6P8I7R2_ACTTE|nr:neuronal acetylcholine receptor subunit beta-4-like [Actinia tenebrosa]XP_031564059.1 neuronal acetylcholine receptor subunit beta-4-like [Actinia tenebrosa]